MARPREFDETAVLDAATECFWRHGYDATSMRDLIETTGLTSASLYNAFGDKRALYRRVLDHYVDGSIAARIRRCRRLAPRAAVAAFFDDILSRSAADPAHKGCLLVNAATDVLAEDDELRAALAEALRRIETFFLDSVRAGQADGTISRAQNADALARHLLGVLMGVRVLARARPERRLLEDVVAVALAALAPPPQSSSAA